MQEKTIYVVDDDQDDRLLLLEAMQNLSKSFKVVEFNNGLELLEVLRKNKQIDIDLLLLDMNMPCLNGLETIRELRNNPNYGTIPIVMISTSSNKALMESAYCAGVNQFAVKPNTFEELYRILDDVVSKFL